MKMNLLYALCLVVASLSCQKTETNPSTTTPNTTLYFPAPQANGTWETTNPEQLGWNTSKTPALLSYLEQNGTRAFIVLKDGKIVMEHYFGNTLLGAKFTVSSNWYWASAGKTVTAFLVGKAQEEKYLSISQKSSDFLGTGWTSLTPQQEAKITIKNQLTMTSGLDDNFGDDNCTKPECLKFLAEPNTRWAYHNAPYTILDKVVENATKQSFQTYFNTKLRDRIGMDGFWQASGYNNVLYSTPRAMARYGLMILAKGKWQNETILADQEYYKAMINTSQNLNLSYGYLWWLNGKTSAMYPGVQTVFPTSLTPTAPADMFAAMGKNGQLLNIVPSQNLVVIRMGDNPDNSLVPMNLQTEIWSKLNEIIKK